LARPHTPFRHPGKSQRDLSGTQQRRPERAATAEPEVGAEIRDTHHLPSQVVRVPIFMKFKGNDRDFVSDKPPTAIGYFAGFIITCVLIIVLFFGDHLMQFIFSGSLTLPPENRRMIPHQFIPPEYRS
jgi:hypothetical protein